MRHRLALLTTVFLSYFLLLPLLLSLLLDVLGWMAHVVGLKRTALLLLVASKKTDDGYNRLIAQILHPLTLWISGKKPRVENVTE